MKKVLVILVVLAMTGIASAAMIANPEDFASYTSGTVLNGPEGDKMGGGGATWSGWGSGSGTGGWAGGISGSVTAGSGASAGCSGPEQRYLGLDEHPHRRRSDRRRQGPDPQRGFVPG